MSPLLAAVVDAARDLAWHPTANFGRGIAYDERIQAHRRLLEALEAWPGSLSVNSSPQLVALVAAIRRVASATYSNRTGAPYWTRRRFVLELRGCLDIYDHTTHAWPVRRTCWTPVYDLRQRRPRTDIEPVRRAKSCTDCAYRKGSPERERDEDLEGLPGFWCHQGLRRPKAWRHPDGRIRLVDLSTSPDYQPPIVAHVPYRADGRPADRCAGWYATVGRAVNPRPRRGVNTPAGGASDGTTR